MEVGFRRRGLRPPFSISYYLSNELSIVACSLAVKPLHFTKSSFGRNDLASPRALRRTDDFPKTRI